ncbi:hypothetical protein JQ624_37035 [Bradyrhizobium sp. AUGA SZCCT0283]|nr:hypothetical protein [Bradyrhizobium sp. AUGA SZCCT0283]
MTTPVADPTLSVGGRGGAVRIGVNVSTTDPNDSVNVNIRGLSRNQTITNNLDGQTSSGNNITLSAARVDSGLVLNSYARGGSSRTTLTLTANANDPVTGTVTSAAPQTITVTNLRSAATTTLSSQAAVTSSPAATSTTTTSLGREFLGSPNQAQASNAVATAAPALISQIRDQVGRGVATSVSQTIAVTNSSPVTATPTASVASQSYALLNQYLAGSTGRGDLGQIVASVSNGATSGQVSFLTRPQH